MRPGSAYQALPGWLRVRSRPRVVEDDVWYRSLVYEAYRRRLEIDHCVTAVLEVPATGAVEVVTLHRPAGDRETGAADRRARSPPEARRP